MTDEPNTAFPTSGEELEDPHQASFVARIYDGEHSENGEDIAWCLRLARAAGGPIADLGCGTGRLALPLAEAGHAVLAIDRSPAMLEQLRVKLDLRPTLVRQRVQIERADLAHWPAHYRDLALAIIGYNTFAALLTADDQLRCLAGIRAALRPGGRLAIATASVSAQVIGLPDGISREAYRRPAPEVGPGVELVRRDIQRWTDETRQLRQLALLYDVLEPDGGRRRYQYEYAARYSSRWELEHLLVRCGFSDVRVAGGYNDEPYSAAAGLLVMGARKGELTPPARSPSRQSRPPGAR